MNVVALPFDSGYATFGHFVEREHVGEAIGTDGTSLGLFSTAVAAAAALVEAARTAQQANDPKDRRFDSSGKACRVAKTPF
jgi:hypothetical protein